MNFSDFVLETERLRLIALNESYAEDIFANFNSEVTKYMFPRPAAKISETLDFVRGQADKNLRGLDIGFAVTKKGGEFLGCGGLHGVCRAVPELGIWIKKPAHGNGYGKEAMRGVTFWAAENLPHILGIMYPVDFCNAASRRIPESMGGVIVGKADKLNLSGNTLHLVNYFIDAKVLRENIQ